MIGIEPPSLSTAPVGTKGGDQRLWRFVLVSDGKSTLGDNGGVQQAEWNSQDRGGQTDDRLSQGRSGSTSGASVSGVWV